MKEGLWKLVTGEETEPVDEGERAKFATGRDRALATVVLSGDPAILYLIEDPEDPVVVWKKLADQYEKKTWARRLARSASEVAFYEIARRRICSSAPQGNNRDI